MLSLFADRTGLEPATSAVTGRHSNQLNYRSVLFKRGKDRCADFKTTNISFKKINFVRQVASVNTPKTS